MDPNITSLDQAKILYAIWFIPPEDIGSRAAKVAESTLSQIEATKDAFGNVCSHFESDGRYWFCYGPRFEQYFCNIPPYPKYDHTPLEFYIKQVEEYLKARNAFLDSLIAHFEVASLAQNLSQ